MTPSSALVILPTYNEVENLPIVVTGLMAHANVRLLIVDDQSPDGTGALGDALADQYPGRIEILHRTGPRGLGRSYLDGFQKAINEPVQVVCQMDADLSHDPAQLPTLIAATAASDLVIGSRYIPKGTVVNWPLRRRLLSRFANNYVRTVTRMRMHDCTSGYRCWRRAALAALPLDRISSEGYSFLVETLFIAERGGLQIGEVPITFVERRLGHSKLSGAVILESAVTPWRIVAKHRPAARLQIEPPSARR
jgi:dolichol-phosphate mannosyltransferase